MAGQMWANRVEEGLSTTHDSSIFMCLSTSMAEQLNAACREAEQLLAERGTGAATQGGTPSRTGGGSSSGSSDGSGGGSTRGSGGYTGSGNAGAGRGAGTPQPFRFLA